MRRTTLVLTLAIINGPAGVKILVVLHIHVALFSGITMRFRTQRVPIFHFLSHRRITGGFLEDVHPACNSFPRQHLSLPSRAFYSGTRLAESGLRLLLEEFHPEIRRQESNPQA